MPSGPTAPPPPGPLGRPAPKAWIAALVLALGFVAWCDHARRGHVERISNVANEDAPVDRASPTGYAGGKRWLIVPEHNNPTYHWIEETQLMLARGDWRVRHIDYENAPLGRDVGAASPYRWWLVLVARVDQAVTGQPAGLCVERAALYADPLLHLLLLAAAAVFAAWRFGSFCSAIVSVGIAVLFPLAGAFVPGVADDQGLGLACTLGGLMLLVAGTLDARRASRWFLLAGLAGGCSLWISAVGQLPVVLGTRRKPSLAALAARGEKGAPLPWRSWAFGGAAVSLLAYVVEYFPGHMRLQLRVNHPLYAVAWMGLGELLSRLDSWMRESRSPRGAREIGTCALAAAAVASLPVAMRWSPDRSFLSDDPLALRLTNLPGGAVASGLSEWIHRAGSAGAVAAACMPVILLGPAVWLLLHERTRGASRAAIAVALGPVLAALVLATGRLGWWHGFDAALVVLLVAVTAAFQVDGNPRITPWMWSALVGFAFAFGLVQVAPASIQSGSIVLRLTRAEVEGVYERTLAHRIADLAGPDGATVLVSPGRTSSLCFYGGLRGLGTYNWENREGVSAEFHIATAMQPEEAHAVITERGVTHIVLPSWDTDLDEFARMSLRNKEESFIYTLHNTDGGIFSWLRAIPFELPPVAGFEDRSVLLLAVTEDADPATVQGRFVEYLVEMHKLDQAASWSRVLLRYPLGPGLAGGARPAREGERGRGGIHEGVPLDPFQPFTGRGQEPGVGPKGQPRDRARGRGAKRPGPQAGDALRRRGERRAPALPYDGVALPPSRPLQPVRHRDDRSQAACAFIEAAPRETSPGPMSMVTSRRFLPLFVTQYIGAFNDNVFKNAFVLLATFGLARANGWNPSYTVYLIGGLFILPFMLVSGWAGYVSDIWPRHTLVRTLKTFEAVVMLGAAAVLHFDSFYGMWAIIIAMGFISAMFGPLKYGLLPVYLGTDELVGGNAWFEGSSFIAIVTGTFVGARAAFGPGARDEVGVLLVVSSGSSRACRPTSFPRPRPPPRRRSPPGTQGRWGQARPGRSAPFGGSPFSGGA